MVADLIRQHLKGRYFEPFLGGGAVFFRLRPELAVLSDVNRDLINTYIVVQTQPTEVIQKLREMPVSATTYEKIRAAEPEDSVDRAARFLYLNRTAFGGMYRLNRQGKFNVPFGGGERTPEILWQHDLVGRASQALKGADLRVCDFEAAVEQATAGDVIYCDPTYTIAHPNNGFVRYNERNFAWTDQQRLATTVRAAAERGALAIVSNAYHPTLLELYAGEEVHVVERKSTISRVIAGRGTAKECLFVIRR